MSKQLSRSVCLVASCPGGVASNVVTYLAKADVPLSVLMTTVSTVAAVVATPLLVQVLCGSFVPVDQSALLMSTLQVRCLSICRGCHRHIPQVQERYLQTGCPAARWLGLLLESGLPLQCQESCSLCATAGSVNDSALLSMVFS